MLTKKELKEKVDQWYREEKNRILRYQVIMLLIGLGALYRLLN